jgi:hypothetical protein
MFGKRGGLRLVRRDEIASGVPTERVFSEHASAELGLDGADSGLSQRLPGSRDMFEDRGHQRSCEAG